MAGQSRKLTINYGLRYELPTVAYTINGVATELNPQQTAIVGGTPGFHFTAPNHKDWAPRLGIAYRITEKTVFRAGGGIYYNPNQTNSYTFLNLNPPFNNQTELHLVRRTHAGQLVQSVWFPGRLSCHVHHHGGFHRCNDLHRSRQYSPHRA